MMSVVIRYPLITKNTSTPTKPPAKPAKPQFLNFTQTFHIQGDSAFDPNSATLKPGGQKDIDSMMALLKKRAVQVSAIIVVGHTDRFERDKALSEQRARPLAGAVGARAEADDHVVSLDLVFIISFLFALLGVLALVLFVENRPPVQEGEAVDEAARRRRRAAVFGEVLPEVTGDERDDSGERPGSEEWLRAQVPPHHG